MGPWTHGSWAGGDWSRFATQEFGSNTSNYFQDSLQSTFFDFYLKNQPNGWDRQPRVLLNVRHPGENFVMRYEHEWPLARTKWTRFYLDPEKLELSREEKSASKTLRYDPMGEGLTFNLPPLKGPMEITGPSALKLFVSSSTEDADLFVVLRVFEPGGKEVLFLAYLGLLLIPEEGTDQSIAGSFFDGIR